MSKKIIYLLVVVMIFTMASLPLLLSCDILGKVLGDSKSGSFEEKPEAASETEEALPAGEPSRAEGEGEQETGGELPVKEENPSIRLWIEDTIPEDLYSFLIEYIAGSEEIEVVDYRDEGTVNLEIGPVGMVSLDDYFRIESGMEWIIIPVTNFFQLVDGINWEDLKKYWKGEDSELDYFDGSNPGPPELFISGEVYRIFEKIIGPASNINIHMVTDAEIPAAIEKNLSAIALVP
ncbi:MAG: hypothetical protein JW770_00490, partial [Actinobacteria bacterium]|nr:hypothetical protein [Actinomycetota bacterium]